MNSPTSLALADKDLDRAIAEALILLFLQSQLSPSQTVEDEIILLA